MDRQRDQNNVIICIVMHPHRHAKNRRIQNKAEGRRQGQIYIGENHTGARPICITYAVVHPPVTCPKHTAPESMPEDSEPIALGSKETPEYSECIRLTQTDSRLTSD